MEKRVYVKHYPGESGRREENRRPKDGQGPHRQYREEGQRHRSEDGQGPRVRSERIHKHWNHEDERGHRKFDSPHRRMRRPRYKQTTKLFTDKNVMVDFVNIEGEKGHKIDVYKIEDDLYKVVIVHRPLNEDEVEVEIEIKEEVE